MTDSILVSIFIAAAAYAGYRSRLLTVSGAISAFVTGFFVVMGLGFKGLFLLFLFFASSSVWSKMKSANKKKAEELLVKGSQRDWQQVFANGGLAALCSAFYYINGDHVWLIGFCICLAAANSDTWASEIGSMSRGKPVFIGTLKRVERGTSGAVSLLGTTAALVGSILIAITAYYLFQLTAFEMIFIIIIGFFGNVVDTILGAYVQVGYECRHCGLKTEKKAHCGHETKMVKGLSLFNNDTVNFLSGFSALVAGILLH